MGGIREGSVEEARDSPGGVAVSTLQAEGQMNKRVAMGGPGPASCTSEFGDQSPGGDGVGGRGPETWGGGMP